MIFHRSFTPDVENKILDTPQKKCAAQYAVVLLWCYIGRGGILEVFRGVINHKGKGFFCALGKNWRPLNQTFTSSVGGTFSNHYIHVIPKFQSHNPAYPKSRPEPQTLKTLNPKPWILNPKPYTEEIGFRPLPEVLVTGQAHKQNCFTGPHLHISRRGACLE